MEKYLQKAIDELLYISKGERIEDPYLLIPLNMTLSIESQLICKTLQKEIYFTRLSLKHLLEKGNEARRIIKILPILLNPDEIYQGSSNKRFFLVKRIRTIKKGRPHLVAIEITAEKKNIIVTMFQTDEKYLKNYNLLWRSAFPPSQHILF